MSSRSIAAMFRHGDLIEMLSQLTQCLTHLRPLHRRPMPGDEDSRLERRKGFDGASRGDPVGREIHRRALQLRLLGRDCIGRFLRGRDERIAHDQRSIGLSPKRDMARRVPPAYAASAIQACPVRRHPRAGNGDAPQTLPGRQVPAPPRQPLNSGTKIDTASGGRLLRLTAESWKNHFPTLSLVFQL